MRTPANRVANGPLRELFLERCETDPQLGYAMVARRLDWWYRGQPDIRRLQRALGLRPYSNTNGYGQRHYRQKTISRRNAVAILGALLLDPVDLGI